MQERPANFAGRWRLVPRVAILPRVCKYGSTRGRKFSGVYLAPMETVKVLFAVLVSEPLKVTEPCA